MSEPSPGTSARLDRIRRPDPARPRTRDELGKEALYTTAPTAAPSPQVEVRCPRCDVLTGVSVLGLARLLRPPVLWNPVAGRLWARCPTCGRRSWLRIELGQALRALLAQIPGR